MTVTKRNYALSSLSVRWNCHIPRIHFNTLLKMMYRTKDVNGSFAFFTTFIIANFSKNINIYSVVWCLFLSVGIVLCLVDLILRVGSSIYRNLMAAQKLKTITEQWFTCWLRNPRANKLYFAFEFIIFYKKFAKWTQHFYLLHFNFVVVISDSCDIFEMLLLPSIPVFRANRGAINVLFKDNNSDKKTI